MITAELFLKRPGLRTIWLCCSSLVEGNNGSEQLFGEAEKDEACPCRFI